MDHKAASGKKKVVSEGFQSGLKPCGFRGVSEWSETVWFQRGFRVFKTAGSIRGVSLGFEMVFKGLEELVSEGFQTFFFSDGFQRIRTSRS